MDHENIARASHRRGVSCAGSVYQAFADVNKHMTSAPFPRSEGGKCGAVLSAEKVLREMGVGKIDEFEQEFTRRFGSIKCFELLGKKHGKCNDFVGAAAEIADRLLMPEKDR
ncbi:MAG: C_GCAxxG_C_C family protein [Firmicutes bacterium]|nr:C_GCAxxG_C_C family protein [Bacillota bacterium]